MAAGRQAAEAGGRQVVSVFDLVVPCEATWFVASMARLLTSSADSKKGGADDAVSEKGLRYYDNLVSHGRCFNGLESSLLDARLIVC